MGKKMGGTAPNKKEDFSLKPREDGAASARTGGPKDQRQGKPSPDEVRNARVSVARLSVASNTTLLVLKLIFGFLMGSVSVISEGIHSGMDLLAAIIATVAVSKSTKMADEDHAYGHGKAEPISGTLEALLILIAAILIIYESIMKMMNPREVEQLQGGILIMLLSVVLNIVVSRMLMKVAKKTHSLALEADALHLSTDVLTSAGVMVGLVLIYFTGFTIIDPIVAIFVAILIIKAAYDLTKKTFVDLMDSNLPDEDIEKIKGILDEHDHVIHDYHDLRTRMSGHNRFIDLHVVVSRDLGLVETHRLCDHIEREIMTKLENASVLIHCEPCDGHCDKCDQDEVCAELRKEKLDRLRKRKAEIAKRSGKDEEGDGWEDVSKDEKDKIEAGVAKVLKSSKEVVSFHEVEARRRGKKLELTMHVLVKAEISVQRAHDINHAIEDGLKDVFPQLEVIAHMEPCNGNCKECDMEDCGERR